jgi:sporulation protein YlmC with PRC-barrel domain
MSDRHVNYLSSDSLRGTDVVNGQGENLGSLEELMLDLGNGRVAYAVLSFGGLLGVGNKLFALPWQAMRVDQDNKEIVVNVDKELLENAPGFDKDNWPQSSSPEWIADIHSYYGYSYN